jgi:hypothetical protein
VWFVLYSYYPRPKTAPTGTDPDRRRRFREETLALDLQDEHAVDEFLSRWRGSLPLQPAPLAQGRIVADHVLGQGEKGWRIEPTPPLDRIYVFTTTDVDGKEVSRDYARVDWTFQNDRPFKVRLIVRDVGPAAPSDGKAT